MSYAEDRERFMRTALNSIRRCAEYSIEYLQEDDKKEAIVKLKDLMKTCCEIEIDNIAGKEAIKEAAEEFRKRNHEEEEDKDANAKDEDANTNKKSRPIREIYESILADKREKAQSPTMHRKYVEFEKWLNSMTKNDNDEDVAITDQEVQTIDIITKLPIKDPVRITKCGHRFDRESIMSLLKNRRYVRCPTIGCVEDKVTAADIEDDLELRRIIEQNS